MLGTVTIEIFGGDLNNSTTMNETFARNLNN
jgi:hypothetical protein